MLHLKGATLSTLSVDINGDVTTKPFTGTEIASTTVNYGEVNVANDINAILTFTDSRGNSTNYTVPLTMLSYDLPTAIITCQRQNNYYTQTDINVNADYSSLDNKNQITINQK